MLDGFPNHPPATQDVANAGYALRPCKRIIDENPHERKDSIIRGDFSVFFIFDEGKIVVLFNGFQKKTQKTPNTEIEKAIKIKEAYYADKQSQNR